MQRTVNPPTSVYVGSSPTLPIFCLRVRDGLRYHPAKVMCGYTAPKVRSTLRFGRRRATVHRTVCALPQTLNRAGVLNVQLIFYDVLEERYDNLNYRKKHSVFSAEETVRRAKERLYLSFIGYRRKRELRRNAVGSVV